MTEILTLKSENISEENFWPHVFILNLGGWWLEEDSRPKLKIILIIWRIITSSTPVICIFSSTAYIIKQLIIDDYGNALFSLYIFSTLLQPSVNMYFLLKFETPIRAAMDLLNDLTRSTKHPEDMVVIRRNARRIWKILLAIFISASIGLLHWVLRPLIYSGLYGLRSQINHDDWPFILEDQTLYIISYLLEILNVLVIAILLLAFNSIFLCISEYTLCHFSVLKNEFDRLQLMPKLNDTTKLNAIVRRHIMILQICENLRLSTEGIIIIDTLIAVANYCLVLFSITTEENISISKTLNILEVTVSLTLNLFMLCWYSNELSIKCQNFSTIAYLSDWIDGNDNEKKTLIILMGRTCLPMKFGGFIEINLRTIISVLKATFSYYNFLIQALAKKQN